MSQIGRRPAATAELTFSRRFEAFEGGTTSPGPDALARTHFRQLFSALSTGTVTGDTVVSVSLVGVGGLDLRPVDRQAVRARLTTNPRSRKRITSKRISRRPRARHAMMAP